MVGPKGGGGELETFGREAEHKSLLPSTTTGLAAGGPPPLCKRAGAFGPLLRPVLFARALTSATAAQAGRLVLGGPRTENWPFRSVT